MYIYEQVVYPGEHKEIHVEIARLTSGTIISLPIYVFRGTEEGPVVLLSAGLHGDEINGIETLRQMLENGEFEEIHAGTVIVIPIFNIFGFINFSREVTVGKDINRSFPGSLSGSLASRLAYFMTRHILPIIDVGVDFHTGGGNRTNYPQIRITPGDKHAKKLAEGFNAPFTIYSKLIPKSIRHQAARMGKTIIVYEGGEAARLDYEAVQKAYEGTLNLLRSLQMIGGSPERYYQSVMLEHNSWVRAKRSGIVKMIVECGQEVYKDQLLAIIHDPFNTYNIKIHAPYNGYVIGLNNSPIVYQGDPLYHIGYNK